MLETQNGGAGYGFLVGTNRLKRTLFGLALIGAFGLGFLAYRLLVPPPAVTAGDGLLWPSPRQLGEFQLTDHRGQPFDLARVTGHWTLWYFGYTHCPDVCPQTLGVLREVERLLAEQGDAAMPQFVFVSVDPRRDTREVLGRYVRYFGDTFIGVTGDLEHTLALAAQLGVFFVHNDPDANGDYTVDHTSAVLLTDPAGRLVGLLREPHLPDTIAHRVSAIRGVVEGASPGG